MDPNRRRSTNVTASANGTTTQGSTFSILDSTRASTPSLSTAVKPILHRLVQIMFDYQTFSALCKEYLKKLDTNFALVASQRMVELCREIHRLVEKRSPAAEHFMVTTFHQTIKLFNVSVKRALHGEFSDLDNQIVQMLQQSYHLTTLLKVDRKRRHSRGGEQSDTESEVSIGGEGTSSATPNSRLKLSRSASSIFYNGYTGPLSTSVIPPLSNPCSLPQNTTSNGSQYSFRNSLPCSSASIVGVQGQVNQTQTSARPKSFILTSTSQNQSNRENNNPHKGSGGGVTIGYTEDVKQLDTKTNSAVPLTVRRRSSKNMRVPYSNSSSAANTTNTTLKPTLREWQCIKCRVKNDRGEKCNMCGEPKPTTISSKPTLLGEIEPDLYNGKWFCKKCKTPNMLSSDSCVFCSQPRCTGVVQTSGPANEPSRELRSVRRSRSANGLRTTVKQ